MKSEYSFQVRWGETDAAGIVFYPNFYSWMDEATHKYLGAIGISSAELFANQQVSVPLLEANCRFKSPLLFEDKVIIQSSVEELYNKAFKIKHIFVKENQIVAEGYEVRAWTSFKDKPKAYPIPDSIRAKMMQQTEMAEG